MRADMDALPMKEKSGLPFSSARDCAHTCGHDMHTAMLLGAARLLKEREKELPGAVKFMFQPGEELLEGAKDMIAAGILENPKVDAAMACHMITGYPAGVIGYGKGLFPPPATIFGSGFSERAATGHIRRRQWIPSTSASTSIWRFRSF